MAEAHLLVNSSPVPELVLSDLPPIYVLSVHLYAEDVHALEDQLIAAGAIVAHDISKARLFLGALTTAKRAKFELHSRGLKVQDITTEVTATRMVPVDNESVQSDLVDGSESRVRKRRKLTSVSQDEETAITHKEFLPIMDSETEDEDLVAKNLMSQLSMSIASTAGAALSPDTLDPDEPGTISYSDFPEGLVKVVRIGWVSDSLDVGIPRPFEPYIIYEGIIPVEPETQQKIAPLQSSHADAVGTVIHESSQTIKNSSGDISSENAVEGYAQSERLGAGNASPVQTSSVPRRDFSKRTLVYSSQQVRHPANGLIGRPVHLLRKTTSEHDDDVSSVAPEMPRWVKENKIYACERSTPLHTPNDDFVAQLEEIKLERILILDNIGVRAYSTSIASIKAYPCKLTTTKEILSLPGCDHKIAHLFYEWETTGHIQAVDNIQADPALAALRNFYNIWGVGAKTARDFYYDRSRKELDDIIEFEWNSLTRVQQIGLKFYDEFQLKIPRSEVEYIASIITYHAKKVVDEGIECVVVGGYRRGRTENGDVDVIVSHRDESATDQVIIPIVAALETAGWITHSLSIITANSDRGQQPVSYKFNDDKHGTGFDTLDKALVVWQDPVWPSMAEDLAKDSKAKNPNVHRRVDIIVSPWRTVGCAVAGWTSGTTFQRDLRRYAKHRKGWKFDSSGIRQRGTGKWVDVEHWTDSKTRAKTWQEAEKRVFEGLGLEYREPWERNTG